MNHHEQQPTPITSTNEREQGVLGRALNWAGNVLKENKNKLTASAVAGVLTLTLAGCGVNAQAEGPRDDDKSTSAPSPEVTETPETPSESIEIPAGLEAGEVGKLIVETHFTNWLNEGASEELRDRRRDENLTWEELLPIVADENQATYADALYVDGWENSPVLTNSVTGLRDANLSTLEWYSATAWSGEEKPENIEGFKSWLDVTSVEEVSTAEANMRTIEVGYVQMNNSDKNLGPDANSVEATFSITLQSDGSSEKIADIALGSQ